MFSAIRSELTPNTYAFETEPMVKATGFREYDARWLFPAEINLLGVQALGLALGTLIHERGVAPKLVTGHDYRSYSQSIKQALILGLVTAGIEVHDIGLALSPMAYFAQFDLDCACVAMVTASHNENGWTGIKMGMQRPVTFGPDEMSRLRDMVLAGEGRARAGGSYHRDDELRTRYLADLGKGVKLTRPIKAVVACGNGTAGAFAPELLSRLGCTVIPLHTELDYTFPNHNPNPEDLQMLHAMADAVRSHGADLAFGFDGDGDRCGIVDETGAEIFADKVGVMLARDLSTLHPDATFVVDVKSTGLFASDPVLKQNGVRADYWKTGHSYIKRRVSELGALAGFEKSGHFFFNTPIGRGYDDGLLTAIAILGMLERNPGKTMSELYAALPKTWGSPTMSPHCADGDKYRVVGDVTSSIVGMRERGDTLIGQPITEVSTVNGIRVTVGDGTWGLVRASSNKPELVVVVESPTSEAAMRDMFAALDGLLRVHPEVGAYNQTI